MRTMRRSLAVLLALFCLCLAACNEDGAGQSAAGDEKSTETTKWNTYVDLSNDCDKFVGRMASYFDAFGTDAEPVVQGEKVAVFLNPMQPIEFMKRVPETLAESAIKEAEKAPQSELDGKALAFARNVQSIWGVYREAHEYYSAKSYADDGLAKGKELHAGMLAAFPELQRTYEDFVVAMAEQNRVNMLRGAKDMRAEGMTITPAALEFLVAAQEASAELERQQLTVDNIYTLDNAAFKPQYDALVNALSALTAAADDQERVKKEGLDPDRVSGLLSDARHLKGTATSIIERAAQGEPKRDPNSIRLPSVAESSRKNRESPEQFAHLVGEFIKSYNRLLETRRAR